ncbi:MAG: hypothetical protein OXB88_02140 [Bacteriovoracales bacterium]|nr:hypothetical protein [Bacteriovoracales bacterium]
MAFKPISLAFKVFLTCAALWILAHHKSWACSYPPEDPLARQKRDCDQRPDRSWSCGLGRCLLTQEVAETEKDLAQCDGLEDAEAANRCRVEKIKELAKKQKGIDLNQNRLKRKDGYTGVQALVGSYYILAGFTNIVGPKCKALSGRLIGAGGAASVAGSLYAYYEQKKGTDKLKKQYEKLALQTRPSNAQVEAFDYLIEEQRLVEKAADRYAKANTLAAGLFTAGAAAAGIALVRGGLGGEEGGCPVPSSASINDGRPDQSQTLRQDFDPLLFLFPQAFAIPLLPQTLATLPNIIKNAPKLEKSGGGKIRKLLNRPLTRMILGSIGGATALHVASLYRKEGKLAKERREKLIEFRAALVKRLGVFDCPTRDDPRSPECFCFLKENIVNPERKSSEACKSYFPSEEGEDALKPNTYSRFSGGGGDKEGNQTGCLSRQGLFDPDCACRKQLSSSGQNNCQKTSFHLASSPFGGLGSDVGKLVRAGNALSNGALGLDALNGSSLGQGAAKIRKNLEEVAQALDKKLKGNKMVGSMDSKTAFKRLGKMLGSRGVSLSKGFSPGLGQGGPAKEKEVPKPIREAVESFLGGRGNQNWPKRSGPETGTNSLFDFGKAREKKEDPSQAEEYDYAGHDIHPSDSQSLWDILGHRYRQSAYPILFD